MRKFIFVLLLLFLPGCGIELLLIGGGAMIGYGISATHHNHHNHRGHNHKD